MPFESGKDSSSVLRSVLNLLNIGDQNISTQECHQLFQKSASKTPEVFLSAQWSPHQPTVGFAFIVCRPSESSMGCWCLLNLIFRQLMCLWPLGQWRFPYCPDNENYYGKLWCLFAVCVRAIFEVSHLVVQLLM